MTTSGKLAGRHALVTGAGSGIGAAIAKALAAEGARISLAGRRREPLEAVVAEIGAKAFVVDCFDVTSTDAVVQGLAKARETFGPVDILVNNAGKRRAHPSRRQALRPGTTSSRSTSQAFSW